MFTIKSFVLGGNNVLDATQSPSTDAYFNNRWHINEIETYVV